ncbi:MAG: hypothetical protein DMF51_15350 [Acidobacteria bacterium]|nr:MAG: hypothetical protein DMF51_15350 [Acidobacteriota bacterium]
MALEQKLNLRMTQKLIMTPSLQQAIKLLQMTNSRSCRRGPRRRTSRRERTAR